MSHRCDATWCLLLAALALTACGAAGGPDAGPSGLPPGPTSDAGPMAFGDVFGFDEVVPSPAEGAQTDPAVAWTGSDYLLAWVDRGDRLRAGRLGQDGSSRDATPLTIATGGDLHDPGIACAGSACAISWIHSGATGSTWRLLRVTPDGTPIDATPLVFTDGLGLVGATADGFMVLSGDTSALRVTRLGASGAPLDDAPLVVFTDAGGALAPGARIGCDADGCLVAFATCSGACVTQVVRVGADGTVGAPTTLPLAGQPSAVVAGAGRFLVTAGADGTHVVALRVDAAGAPLDAGPLPLFETPGGTLGSFLAVAAGFDGDAFVVAARRSETFIGVTVRRVDPDGLVDSGARLDLGVSADAPGHAVALTCAPGQCLFAATSFPTDDGVTDSDVLVSRFVGTTILGPRAGFFTLAADRQDVPAVGSDGDGYLVVWQDLRHEGATVRAARLSAEGRWRDTTSVGLSDPGFPGNTAQVAWNGSAYQVVWTSHVGIDSVCVGADGSLLNATRDHFATNIPGVSSGRLGCGGGVCYLTVVDPDRTQLWRLGPDGHRLDAAPIDPGAGPAGGWIGSLAFRQGVFVASWITSGASADGIAAISRLGVDGTLLDPVPVPLPVAPGARDVRAVATADDFVVTWTGDLGPSPEGADVGFAILDDAGAALAAGSLTASAAREEWATPVFDGASVVVPWLESGALDQGRVMLRRLHPSGALLEVAPLPVVQGVPASTLATASTGHGDTLVVWDAFVASPGLEATRLQLRLVHE